MKIINKISVVVLVALFTIGLTGPISTTYAATTPSLGAAATFGILGSTYTNTVGGTTINGDLGYTTGPAVAPTVNGTTYIAPNATYTQAGTDQGTALTNLNSQACTSLGAIVTLSGTYTPGCYSSTGAMNIALGTTVTLNGAGTYIFRPAGAFTTGANSIVSLTGGASASDVFWTPTAATTLGANTTFKGTVIDAAGITIGSTVAWTGRALAFGGTVSTDADTITVPNTLRVIKLVVNTGGGTAVASDFNVHVKLGGVDVAGSPALGVVSPGRFYTLSAGTYVVSEDANASYTQSFSGACNSSGSVTLATGDDKTCTITNTFIVGSSSGGGSYIWSVPPLIEVLKVPSPLALPAGPGPVTYTYTLNNIGAVPMTGITMVDDACKSITYVSGDINGNKKFDITETWTYTCQMNLAQTTTNVVVATGWTEGLSATDTASATVVVGQSLVPPLIHVVKKPNVFVLPYGGGAVTYSYTVTNPGTEPLSNVTITDNKCTGLPGRVVGHPGDLNKNNLLESNESWSFTCQTNLTQTTTNTGTATGYANGLSAVDLSLATVLVVSPKLPNTGIGPNENNSFWNIVVLAGTLAIVSIFTFVVLRKRKI